MPRGLLKQYSSTIALIHKSLDVLAIITIYPLTKILYGRTQFDALDLLAMLLAVILFLFMANIFTLYRSWRSSTLREEFQTLFLTIISMILGLLLLAYASKTTATFSRLEIGTWWLLLPLTLMAIRIIIRSILRHFRQGGYNIRSVAIAGNGIGSQRLAHEFESNDWMGIVVAGFFDDRQKPREDAGLNIDATSSGNFDDLIRGAKSNLYDEIYVSLPMKSEDLINRLLKELADTSIPVHVVPDIFTFKMMHARTSHIGAIPIVSIYEAPMDDMEAILKRVLDITLSTIIVFIIAIPMLIIALAIKLTSRGPVLFKQRRYGQSGNEIEVWKFRSMSVTEDGNNIKQASKGDARITPLGAFLRRTSLDELPQFFNVLQGTMSIVGPRPHAVAHNELYRKSIDGYMLRHLVKPGITGWAQVNGWRGETDTDEKMQKRIEYDMEYLQNWSLFLDLKIIFMTIWKGFINKNAY